MKKEHPHAQVLRWIADGESVQFMWTGEGANNEWYELLVELGEKVNKSLLSGSDDYKFRIKPKTITVGDREIEAPVMSGPGYFISDLGRELVWFGDERDINSFADMQKNGRIFATPEAARAAQEAITALLTREPS